MARPKLKKGIVRTARVRLSVMHQMRILDALDSAIHLAELAGDEEFIREYKEVYGIINKLY